MRCEQRMFLFFVSYPFYWQLSSLSLIPNTRTRRAIVAENCLNKNLTPCLVILYMVTTLSGFSGCAVSENTIRTFTAVVTRNSMNMYRFSYVRRRMWQQIVRRTQLTLYSSDRLTL